MPLERTSDGLGFQHMETPEQCRQFAVQCEALAEQAKSERHRAILIKMAQAWRELASKIERRGGQSDR